jgi:hypothetical protein
MKSIVTYREELTKLWGFLTEARLVADGFPGFASVDPNGEAVPLSRASFLEYARLCVPRGPSIAIEKSPNDYILIYGSDAMDKWPKDDPFFNWPFFPLMVDSEGFTVGLTFAEVSADLRLLCVSKDCLYDESMPDEEDLAYVSSRAIWELPGIAEGLLKSRADLVFPGSL